MFIHKHPSTCSLVQSISWKDFDEEGEFSVITQVMLLVHRLPNIKELTLKPYLYNDVHPSIFKYAINKTIQSLDVDLNCNEEAIPCSLQWFWQFVACFQCLRALSIDVIDAYLVKNICSLKSLYQNKLKCSLTSLTLFINSINHVMLLDSLVEAGTFTSNLKILNVHLDSVDFQYEMDLLCSAIQDLVMHCSDHLQILIFNSPILPVPISLESCSNLAQLNYTTGYDSQAESMLNQLQTITSTDIAYISVIFDTIYDIKISDIDVELWNRIDTLLTSPQFASLHKVTIIQKSTLSKGLTFQADILPKLHRCGLLAVLNQT
ncbi:hypothetical protein QCA50_010877 [Cerrena zonata]|uniref:Uncharacterized protein n=1 Tax=Cerrena zonata TaxID=2478898 RepID=A0AAW0GAG7_9APHY